MVQRLNNANEGACCHGAGSLGNGLTVWLREQSLEELAKLAEDYTLAMKGKDQPPYPLQGHQPWKLRKQEHRNGFRTEPRTKVNTAGEKQCFHCHQWGSTIASSEACRKGKLKWGKVGGKSVQMLLDSGCSRTMVSANSVDSSKISKAETVAVLCVHGDTVEYPTAMVELAGKQTLLLPLAYRYQCSLEETSTISEVDGSLQILDTWWRLGLKRRYENRNRWMI